MKLKIISNRLPVNIERKNDEYIIKESTGGLVTGISSYLSSMKTSSLDKSKYRWIGWPGIPVTEKDREIIKKKIGPQNLIPVFIGERIMEKFYLGFCNKTIWPLFHYFQEFTYYDNEMWENYKTVNRIFCDVVSENAESNNFLWIHDYHLMLLPKLLRKKFPNSKIGFFLHIPFPHFEVFRLLPPGWQEEILRGLLGADLIGFHTYDYTKYFLGSVLRILGLESKMGEIQMEERIIKADTFPMGIDFNNFEKLSNSAMVQKEKDRLTNNLKGRKIILSIDRLDYTKGIVNRLQGYQIFLKNNPEWKEKVTLLAVVVPSRIGVDKYSQMKREIDEIIGKINGDFGTVTWSPIIYQYKYFNIEQLSALYTISDVALITPLRDGMNLIAKEYLASRKDNTGVLILSEMAGASKELGETIMINPNHIEDIASAIKSALLMNKSEQIRINQIMRRRLKTGNVVNWANSFWVSLTNIKSEQKKFDKKLFDDEIKKSLLNDFKRSRRKIIFLDYDGTVVPFTGTPQQAIPDKEILDLLTGVSNISGTHLILISGRDRVTMSEWFRKIPVSLVAEHGVWIKKKNKNWKLAKKMDDKWKRKLKPILNKYTDLLPGSFLEEKSYSIVWHYRKSDPVHGNVVANDLHEKLLDFTSNLNLQILRGSKNIEIKSIDINKGTAVIDFHPESNYGFILAIGDDWTDEDMFKALPASAYTIKVGMAKSYSRFNFYSYSEARNLLREIINENR